MLASPLNGDFYQFFRKEFSSHSTGQCSFRAAPSFQQLLNLLRSSTKFSRRKVRKRARYYANIDFPVVPPLPCIFSPRTLLAFSRIVTYPRRKQRVLSTQSSFLDARKPKYKACRHFKKAEEIPKNLITIYNGDRVVRCNKTFALKHADVLRLKFWGILNE